jgi:hypothetical protein
MAREIGSFGMRIAPAKEACQACPEWIDSLWSIGTARNAFLGGENHYHEKRYQTAEKYDNLLWQGIGTK